MLARAEQDGVVNDEIREYVSAHRTSSNRTRYALYVVVVATVLAGIANLNVSDLGWPQRRLGAWYAPRKDTAVTRYQQAAATYRPAPTESLKSLPFFGGDPERLKIAREEYQRQYVSRVQLTASPIPGVTLDVNDLGTVGGVALLLLMSVLVVCVGREHENLYLALYKVTRLDQAARPAAVDGGGGARGESRANLLYHALAMNQVLAHPPTLARWRRNRVLGGLLLLIFFFPSFVYLWIFLTNLKTEPAAAAYSFDSYHFDPRPYEYVQGALVIGLFTLSALAALYSHAMAARWRRCFERINPGRAMAPQMSRRQWLKVPTGKQAISRLKSWLTSGRGATPAREAQCLHDLRSELVDTVTTQSARVRQMDSTGTVKVSESHEVSDPISSAELEEMMQALVEAGEAAARSQYRLDGARGGDLELISFESTLNEVSDRRWTVTGAWHLRYRVVAHGGGAAVDRAGGVKAGTPVVFAVLGFWASAGMLRALAPRKPREPARGPDAA
jgi:hypothetical protein